MSWQPTASIVHLKERANFIDQIRLFFKNRNYLEVETPYMAHFGVTDIHLKNIQAFFRGQRYYLQTSPEFHMKRLLSAGSGPIFQIARVFRDDEYGKWHNPEFTLLEWYQLDVDHHYLIDEMQSLFQFLFDCPAFMHLSYQEAFIQFCQFDPFDISLNELQQKCYLFGLEKILQETDSLDQYLQLFMAFVVEPGLAKIPAPVVIDDFPPSQACLAIVEGNRAHRFEVYWQGVELANGFHELTDAEAQKKRFQEDIKMRQLMGEQKIEMDIQLLEALAHGMPACSGVALGLDRLLALKLKQASINNVMSFSFPAI